MSLRRPVGKGYRLVGGTQCRMIAQRKNCMKSNANGNLDEITLLVVDNQPLMVEGICSALRGIPSAQITGVASSGKEAIEKSAKLRPEIILLDNELKGMTGLETMRFILTRTPESKVILLSSSRGEDRAVEAFRTGGRGFIPKDISANALRDAVLLVHAEKHCFVNLLNHSPSKMSEREEKSHCGGQLTTREIETLICICKGFTNKEAASELKIGVRAIESYRAALMKKLGVRSVAELTTYALRKGLFVP